jgi:hypothetical protein
MTMKVWVPIIAGSYFALGYLMSMMLAYRAGKHYMAPHPGDRHYNGGPRYLECKVPYCDNIGYQTRIIYVAAIAAWPLFLIWWCLTAPATIIEKASMLMHSPPKNAHPWPEKEDGHA